GLILRARALKRWHCWCCVEEFGPIRASDPHTDGKKEVDMLKSMKSSAPEKDKSAAANAVEEIAPIAMPTLTQAEAATEMIPSLIEKVGATTIAEIDRLIAELHEA